jgi:hypothetical protein|nr:MAG TPA: homing endonuclease [Crassvirales sp.]
MRKFNPEKELEILRMYREGRTQKQIADELNTYNTSIRRVLIRNGIIPKGNDKQQRLCKHNPFRKNDEYSDYFLGLLITDGNIDDRHRIRLSLNERDGYLIQEFLNWASPKSKVTKTLQKLNNSYMWSASITNDDAYEYLIKRGNFHNKSFEAKLYTPINYTILRGIFDGDGGYAITNSGSTLRFYICGKSVVFIKQIETFLVKNGYSPRVTYIHDLWYVNLYRVEDVIRIGEQLYNNAHIFCRRKYERWLAFYENRRANGVNSGEEMAIQS